MKEFDVGLCVGITLSFIVIIFISIVYPSASSKAIEECQKSLPRNEFCEIVAVPKKVVK